MWFVRWRLNGDIGIWKIDLDSELKPTGEPVPLSQSSFASPRDLTISRDGKRMAFTAALSTSQIMSQRISGAKEDPIVLTHDVSYRYALVRSSPDGSNFVYTAIPRNGEARVWVDRAYGSGLRGIGGQMSVRHFGGVCDRHAR